MKTASTSLLLFSALFTFLNPRIGFSHIIIEAGSYTAPAIVRKSVEGHPEAVINLHSLSETRIKLTGPVAESLDLKESRGLQIKVRFKNKVTTSTGEAELLEWTALKGAVPRQLDNNLKQVPNAANKNE